MLLGSGRAGGEGPGRQQLFAGAKEQWISQWPAPWGFILSIVLRNYDCCQCVGEPCFKQCDQLLFGTAPGALFAKPTGGL